MARMKEPHHVGFDMTPMIDIVFNLIIFFMLVSEFTKAMIVRLELPEPAKEIVKAKPKEDGRVIVNVTSEVDGSIGGISCEGRSWEEERLPELMRYLKTWKKEKLQVELRADKRLKWSVVADIMLACAKEKIMRIHFVAKKK